MVIELKQRAPRVRFKHPVRVVPLDGSPRIYRTLAANLSRRGMFVRMPEPLPKGTKVALSLEAAGQALPFAEAEIAWCRVTESQLPGRFTGFGVRFTSFLNPRAPELVDYLVKNLDRGRPLKLAPRRSRRKPLAVGLVGLAAVLVLAFVAHSLSNIGGAGQGEGTSEGTAEVGAAPGPPSREALERRDEAGPPAPPELVAAALDESAPPEVPGADPPPAPPVAVSSSGSTEAEPPADSRAAAGPVAQAPVPPVVADGSAAAQAAAPPVETKAPPAVQANGSQGAARKEAAPTPASPVAQKHAPATTGAPAEPPRRTVADTSTPGRLALPSGAARALTWSKDGDEVHFSVELAPGAAVSRSFLLSGPPRLVLDLDGQAPRKSFALQEPAPWFMQVRIGPHGHSTRLVVDLAHEPDALATRPGGATLTFRP